jgi:hypothetical protein
MADMKNFSQLYDVVMNIEENTIIPFLNEKWIGKDKQESLFRLFAYLNVIKEFDNYSLCDGNFNEGTLSKNSVRTILFDKNLKDKGDKSDLSLISNDCETLIATTSKSLDSYCIGDLETDPIQLIYQQKYVSRYSLRICIVVRDKHELYELAKKAERTSKRIKDVISDPSTIIFDWTDIDIWFNIAKDVYKDKTVKDICKFAKPPLINKFHQNIAIMNTIAISQYYKDILWGQIPRSGKSYIIAGTIYKAMATTTTATTNTFNIIIITTAPNETKEQYLEMFNSYCQFEDFTIHYMNDVKKPKLTNKNIIICSKQFLQTKGVKEDKVKSIKWLKDMKFNWRFIDESHNGGTTDLSKKVLEAYGNTEGVISVYITATYMKPRQTFNIPIEATVLWDLEDVKLCQSIDKEASVNKLVEKYGDCVLKVLAKSNKDDIKEDYSRYPTLEFMKFDFKYEVKQAIIDKYKDTNKGFSAEAIFLLKYKETKDKAVKSVVDTIGEFQDEEGVINLLHSIFGKEEYDDIFTTKDTSSVFSEISRICKNGNINSRSFSVEDPLIVLAFLPCNLHNTPLSRLQETLRNVIIKHNILPEYDVIYLNSKDNNSRTSKEIINDALKNVKLANKKGLLVLSGRMCSLAVSLPKCDIVLMLNNTESYDTYYQMIFRCMTEDANKKIGFVVDMNLQRVCCVIAEYAAKICKGNNTTTKDAIKYVLEQNIIGFRSTEWMNNYFGLSNVNIDKVVNEVYNIYSSNPSNAIDGILKSLDFKIKVLTKHQELFNKIFSTKASAKKIKKVLGDLTNNIEVKKGIDNLVFGDSGDSGDNSSVISDDTDTSTGSIIKNVNLMTDIIKPLMSLLCILTTNADGSATTFKDMCIWIKGSKEEKSIIISQLAIWWNKTASITSDTSDVIDMFITLYDTYLYNNEEFNSAFMRLKEMFCISKNNKDELSKIIDKYLVPQDIEKQQNAEVSTPYILRKEMISKIPDDFWKSPRKVFEPCAGKGGFLLDIINKFMNGLQELYEDEEERYRVIVEECLYWSEFNATNVYICKLLLDPFGKYKLNYNKGDTLALDIKEKWAIDGFDAVIGNPPYQNSNGSSNGTLWDKFILYGLNYLKYNGYLVYVNPSGWRNILGKFKNIQLEMKKYWIKYLEIHNENDGLKLFNAETRYDWYILQKNTDGDVITEIMFEDKKVKEINIKNLEFIPNGDYELYNTLLAKENEERCEVLHNESIYEIRKKWMSKIKSNEYNIPCVYMINNKDVIKPLYSSKNNGHIGISKLMWSNGRIKSIGSCIDYEGEYGLTQFAYAIVDEKNKLEYIKKAFDSKRFRKLMELCAVGQLTINYKIIKLFRKDFWKEFI